MNFHQDLVNAMQSAGFTGVEEVSMCEGAVVFDYHGQNKNIITKKHAQSEMIQRVSKTLAAKSFYWDGRETWGIKMASFEYYFIFDDEPDIKSGRVYVDGGES